MDLTKSYCSLRSFKSSVSGHPVSIGHKQRHLHGIEFVEEHHHHIPGPEDASIELRQLLVGEREDRGNTPHADAGEDRLELEVAFPPLLVEEGPQELQQSWAGGTLDARNASARLACPNAQAGEQDPVVALFGPHLSSRQKQGAWVQAGLCLYGT